MKLVVIRENRRFGAKKVYYSGVVLYVEKRLFNGSIQTKNDFDARRWHVDWAGIVSRRPLRLNCARGCRIINLM